MFIMKTMNQIDLHRVDLNLLVVFQTIMDEKSVTRASHRLNVSQSAVSAALGRLRELFKDKLFSRTRDGMAPTPRALEISQWLSPSLTSISKVVFEDTRFDPKTSSKVLHVAMSDDVELAFAPWFAQQKAAQQWSVGLSLHQTNSETWVDTLQQPGMDLVLTSGTQPVANVRTVPLLSGNYLCVFNPTLLGLSKELTIREFTDTPHIRVAFNAQIGWVDEIFANEGRSRNTFVSVSHFSALPTLLMQVPALATIPYYAANVIAENTELAVARPPFQTPKFIVSAKWATEKDGLPENLWLRQLVSQFAKHLESGEL
jgi:LysR family transcriptional activator of mexEF-oprN operon